MIVVDASALIAITWNEPERVLFERRLLQASQAHISVISLFEASMITYARGGAGAIGEMDIIVKNFSFRAEPVQLSQLPVLRDAFARYGKGRGHPAQLNFGDCFSYALAKLMGLPLLFKGDDFRHTDIMAAA